MVKNIFDISLWHEEIECCDFEEKTSGINENFILYAPSFDILKMNIPSIFGPFNRTGKIVGNIELKNGNSFKRIKCIVDENELITGYSNDSIKTELDLFFIGETSQLIGMMRQFRYFPGIYLIQDSQGNYLTIGTKVSPALVGDYKFTTGKKYEDNTGVQVKLTSNACPYIYTGKIDYINESDFTNEYDKDYK